MVTELSTEMTPVTTRLVTLTVLDAVTAPPPAAPTSGRFCASSRVNVPAIKTTLSLQIEWERQTHDFARGVTHGDALGWRQSEIHDEQRRRTQEQQKDYTQVRRNSLRSGCTLGGGKLNWDCGHRNMTRGVVFGCLNGRSLTRDVNKNSY